MDLDLDAIEQTALAAQGRYFPDVAAEMFDHGNVVKFIAEVGTPYVVLALVSRIRELEAIAATDDERRAAHWFVEGNDSIRERFAVMEMLKRIAVKP